MGVFLNVENGFGSDHSSLVPLFRASGLDPSFAALLAYFFTHERGVLQNSVIDLVVGIFQGSNVATLVYTLAQGVPLGAAGQITGSGLAVSLLDNTVTFFSGETELDSRQAAANWLAIAVPLLEAFGFCLSPYSA